MPVRTRAGAAPGATASHSRRQRGDDTRRGRPRSLPGRRGGAPAAPKPRLFPAPPPSSRNSVPKPQQQPERRETRGLRIPPAAARRALSESPPPHHPAGSGVATKLPASLGHAPRGGGLARPLRRVWSLSFRKAGGVRTPVPHFEASGHTVSDLVKVKG